MYRMRSDDVSPKIYLSVIIQIPVGALDAAASSQIWRSRPSRAFGRCGFRETFHRISLFLRPHLSTPAASSSVQLLRNVQFPPN